MDEMEVLRALGEVDARLKQHRRDLDAARLVIAEAEQDVASAERHREEMKAEVDALKTRERDLQRRIETYGARRRSAESMLATGAGDAEAAMRQLSQVRGIVDELETDTLMVMEEQGAARAALDAAAATVEAAKAAEQEARATVPARIAELEGIVAELEAEREGLTAQLHPELRTRYERLLAAKGRAVALAAGNTCSVCQRTIGAQVLMEVKKGRLHTCEGCRRYLVVTG